ncbi:MAG: pentapeptide repeat-containing protein [Deltaproteobacteria bacterium]|jgi:uncharacterized protein YjbI with pentapeptide repeats|nr:pentapeptide repeat-containing protein [Deltaproteobacteria bacterium]
MRCAGFSLGNAFFFLIILQAGVLSMPNTSFSRVNLQEIVRTPRSLSGQYIKDGLLEDLEIKNALVTGLRMQNVKFLKSSFENITFEDCIFEKVNFARTNFTNVLFKNCVFKEYGKRSDPDNLTQITGTARDVMFQACELRNIDFSFSDASSGYLLFKDISKASSVEVNGPFIFSGGAHIRIDNCSIQSGIIGDDDAASAMVRNSTFANASVYADKTFISGSKFSNGSNPGGMLLVIINSELTGGNLHIGGTAYVLNNDYKYTEKKTPYGDFLAGVGIKTLKPENKVYITGKPGEHSLRIISGDVEVRNITLVRPIISQLNNSAPLTALNLKDVTLQGAYWGALTLLGGKWENVRIEPPVEVKRTTIQNVQAYRLEYPKGLPFTDKSQIRMEVKEVNQPFDWPEIVAPTPEEHGLTWWPEVEPGYRPDHVSRQ